MGLLLVINNVDKYIDKEKAKTINKLKTKEEGIKKNNIKVRDRMRKCH